LNFPVFRRAHKSFAQFFFVIRNRENYLLRFKTGLGDNGGPFNDGVQPFIAQGVIGGKPGIVKNTANTSVIFSLPLLAAEIMAESGLPEFSISTMPKSEIILCRS